MIYAAEATILARLAALCAPGSILLGTLADVDLTDDSGAAVIGKLMLTSISPTSQTGANARLQIGYAFIEGGQVARHLRRLPPCHPPKPSQATSPTPLTDESRP